MAAVEDWNARKVVLGKSTFEIGKLLVMEQFALIEEVRPHLGKLAGALSGLGVDRGASTQIWVGVLVMQMLSTIPQDVLKSIQSRLFGQIEFVDANRSVPVVLAGREDEAFDNALHIYELLARSAYVNFSESVSGFLSRMDGMQASLRQNIETSIQESPTP